MTDAPVEVDGSARYDRRVVKPTNATKAEKRRAEAKHLRGLFANLAPDREMVDELINERRAEAAAEERRISTLHHRARD